MQAVEACDDDYAELLLPVQQSRVLCSPHMYVWHHPAQHHWQDHVLAAWLPACLLTW